MEDTNIYDSVNKQVKNIVILLIVVCIFAGLVFLGWKTLFFGKATIVIEGIHDPINNRLSVDDKTLYPSGPEGKIYKFSTSTGKKEIKLVGPFIDTETITLDISALTEAEATITSSVLSGQQLASVLLGDSKSKDIVDTKTFGELDEWFVVKTVGGEEFDFYVYSFDYESGWKEVVDGHKIDIKSEVSGPIPDELVEYLEDQAGD